VESIPVTRRSGSPLWRLKGRDRELKVLQRAARQPHTPGIMLTGMPGAGNTRLGLEMLSCARSVGFTTAWGGGHSGHPCHSVGVDSTNRGEAPQPARV
jgi:hypothetical protein